MSKLDIQDTREIADFADPNICRDALLFYADSTLHYDDHERYEKAFYRRKLRPHVLKHIDHSTPLKQADIGNYSALSANRVLASMYEQDFMILPDGESQEFDLDDFREFYSPERRSAAACAIPMLERYLFDFLKTEVEVAGDWNLGTVNTYFSEYAGSLEASSEPLVSADTLASSTDPTTATQDFLVQLAPDFLLESSPMARYSAGSFGKIGTNLFKVIIDEFGYGVYDKKHSVLFTETMRSAGLNPSVHAYWQYYLNGSLLLSNYYNMITRDKRNIFRYIGALYQAETTFITACAQWRAVLRDIFPGLDVRYFSEHAHIDQHHSQMVFNDLVTPAIRTYGEVAAKDIVRGFEEACWLGEYADNDFRQQIEWKDAAHEYQRLHDQLFSRIQQKAKGGAVPLQTFVEPIGELSITHTHDGDELCHINSGQMEYLNGFGKSTILREGDGIVIRRGRLHGALIESESCDYSIYTLEDYKRWL